MHRSALVIALLFSGATTLLAQTTPTVPGFELAANLISNDGSPNGLIKGDFNNDGKLDLVIQDGAGPSGSSTSSQYAISLLLGNGDGTFKAPVVIGTDNALVEYIDVADFNHDGNLDIITFDSSVNAFYVRYGNGNGTFQAPLVISTAAAPIAGTISTFFNDGYTDVAIADSNGDIELFRNQGGAKNFVLSSTIQSVVPPSTNYFIKLRAGDLNGTGVSDLAVLTSTTAYVFWNNGQGIFTKALLSNYAYPVDLSVGSVNQAPNADIIVSYSCNNEAPLEPGRDNPSTCAGLDVFYGQGNNKTFFRTAVTDNGIVAATSVAAIDVNGDGIADLVATDQQPNGTVLGLYAWLGKSDGSFEQSPQVYNTGSNGLLVAGDFNRDGMMDFAQLGGGNLETYINGGQRGPCQTSSISPTVVVCQPVNNTYVQPVVTVEATAYDKNKVTALQEYVDGTLEYSEPVTSLDYTSSTLSLGSHSFVTKAFDSTGVSFSSDRTVTVYAGTPGPTCPTALGTATICLPATSTSSSTTVQILANGYTANIPEAAQLYVDGKLVVNNQGYCGSNGTCVGGTSYVDTTQTLAAGSHDLVFKLFDASGNVYTAQKTVTVQ